MESQIIIRENVWFMYMSNCQIIQYAISNRYHQPVINIHHLPDFLFMSGNEISSKNY